MGILDRTIGYRRELLAATHSLVALLLVLMAAGAPHCPLSELFGVTALPPLFDGVLLVLIGLAIPRFEAHFTPCIEIGWRLAANHWNRGYATEGAKAALAFGFRWLNIDEIVSFTVPANARSRQVMEKLGMSRTPKDDFDHPLLSEGHPLRRHVLYRASRPSQAGGGAGPEEHMA